MIKKIEWFQFISNFGNFVKSELLCSKDFRYPPHWQITNQLFDCCLREFHWHKVFKEIKKVTLFSGDLCFIFANWIVRHTLLCLVKGGYSSSALLCNLLWEVEKFPVALQNCKIFHFSRHFFGVTCQRIVSLTLSHFHACGKAWQRPRVILNLLSLAFMFCKLINSSFYCVFYVCIR